MKTSLFNDTPRHQFVSSLAGNGKNTFKRYGRLPLRYAGGKSLAVGHILQHFPDGIKKMASPFMGGGSIEIACAKEIGVEVMGYDIFDVLVAYWQTQLRDKDALVNILRGWSPTQETYRKVKATLKAHWLKEKLIENKSELAAHYWFNHNLSYGPGFLGWMSKIYECERRYSRLVDKAANFECENLKVKCGSFDKTIKRHRNDFLYCDPPYYLDGDSKMFKGIYPQRNFPVHHNGFNHRLLSDLLHQHKGGFVLSYNDCDAIRDLYSKFEIKIVKWQYTLGQGETRIGENRINNKSDHVKASHEILVIGK